MYRLDTMTITHMNCSNVSQVNIQTSNSRNSKLDNLFESKENMQIYMPNTAPRPQQVKISRELSSNESLIISEVQKCFTYWYEPWKLCYLVDTPKFSAVFDLMEGLMHYESQILDSCAEFPSERLNAIVRAVARLIDYGNAILNIDITLRTSDDTLSELDSTRMTTIELYMAHIEAHKLREKLLESYFKSKLLNNSEIDTNSISSNSPSTTSLKVPHSTSWNFSSPTIDRSQRFSVGSTTSINTLGPVAASSSPDGRRTPVLSASCIEVKALSSTEDLSESQLEMKHMIATIRSETFSCIENSSTRLTLLLGALAKVDDLLSLPATLGKLTNCFNLLDTLLDTIEKLPIESRTEEVRLIAKSIFKILVRKVYIDDRDSCIEFQHTHWTTYLLSLIRMMSSNDFNFYLKTFSNLPDLRSFLKDYLFIIKRLISPRAYEDETRPQSSTLLGNESSWTIYPNCWVEMSLLVCSTFLKSLMYLYKILRQYFNSNTEIWHSYIDCLIHFIVQDVLLQDRPMLKKRQALLADDLRKTSAEYVWITWDSLNLDQRFRIIEDTIEPLLKASMMLRSRQRSILLPIFYSMMQCDYANQYLNPRESFYSSSSIYDELQISREKNISLATGGATKNLNVQEKARRQNSEESLPYLSFQCHQNMRSFCDDGTVLTKFTHLIVGKLNSLMIDQAYGDEEFTSDLCAALNGLNSEYYQRNQTLSSYADLVQFKSMAKHTSDLVSEFMQICLDLRRASKLSYNHLHLLCLFKLVLFFKDKVDRADLYLSYLHKLWFLHHTTGRFVEAGFALLEHAKSLPWTNKPLESHYRILTRSFQSPEPLCDYMGLKLFLYTTIIEYFDKGHVWEAAVPLCRELIDILQFKLYDYAKLAQVLARLSNFFSNISNGCNGSGQLRSQPEYFRVSFYGIGFPDSLKNSTMVYRGKPFEKLSDFNATLMSKYPDAKLLKTLDQPNESLLLETDAKYLQVNACSPLVDLECKFSAISSSLLDSQQQRIDVQELQDSIVSYYKYNECDKFEFSRKISVPKGVSSILSGDNQSDNFANMWRERIILTTNSLPGMLPFFPVFLTETNTISPIECAIEDLLRANDRLQSMVNRFKADKRQEEDVRPLGQVLLGVVDAAVNGGITKYEQAFFSANTSNSITTNNKHDSIKYINSTTNHKQNIDSELYTTAMDHQQTANLTHTLLANNTSTLAKDNRSVSNLTVSTLSYEQGLPNQVETETKTTALDQEIDNGNSLPTSEPSLSQIERLKCLIARQVPILEEAIKLHRERVADVMRPQHDHLEASFKKLKNHVLSKYFRFLPADYNRSANTTRSFRSLARSPNRSMRSDSRVWATLSSNSPISSDGSGRFGRKRMSDVGSGSSGVRSVKMSQQKECSGGISGDVDAADGEVVIASHMERTNSAKDIPYRKLINERQSLPFLSALQNFGISEKVPPAFDSSQAKLDDGNSKAMSFNDSEQNQTFSKQLKVFISPAPSNLQQEQYSNQHQFTSSMNSTYVCISDIMRSVNQPDDDSKYVHLSSSPLSFDNENESDVTLETHRKDCEDRDDEERIQEHFDAPNIVKL